MAKRGRDVGSIPRFGILQAWAPAGMRDEGGRLLPIQPTVAFDVSPLFSIHRPQPQPGPPSWVTPRASPRPTGLPTSTPIHLQRYRLKILPHRFLAGNTSVLPSDLRSGPHPSQL